MSKGIFISLEGPDGAGKTTQIGYIREYFEAKGKEVLITREPGGTAISEKLREILLDKANMEMADTTEMLIYAAARAQLVAQVIKPALDRKDSDQRPVCGLQHCLSGIWKRPGGSGENCQSQRNSQGWSRT